ncbi:MAG: patatin-like phospholipase family protein [Chitinophagaceae bacterium]|nr:patatin-like phospholipase family protein [Chitinophagaceae bacterium]MBP7108994.1 patatin-like phospholipase family protein [Chitinophagaceae bacterium]MBP7314483.1 patatin-like phospholipase family protein [Chitinophagaceae bacterium]
MKAWFRGFIYSFPIQLILLHLRKYQVLLIFWFILFSVVNGSFMKTFGADSLFLGPEYLGNVNAFSMAIVGASIGMFIMSWNIATFILFSRYFRFLSATTNPFLKYCINNSVIPILFLAFYFFKAYRFDQYKELISPTEILFLFGGFLSGLIFILSVSMIYFFRADRSILRKMMPVISNPKSYITHLKPIQEVYHGATTLKVEVYFETPFRIRAVRDVSHYTDDFVATIFKKHHFAAILSVFAAFIFLLIIGFFLDYAFFQLPAAASITIFFSILLGVAASITYFLQSWSIPYLIVLVLILNIFYKQDWIDPRNKAYGLNYWNKTERPSYTKEGLAELCKPENVEADKKNMRGILDAWKKKQDSEKPLLVLINTSGGGHRSATFTMSVLQYLDSITNGKILQKTFLINGASGGMIGAAYFRELYLRKQQGKNIRLQDKKYVDDIAGDLLNPIFTSFFARDLISPAQKFKVGPYSYVKDRGYAFEQKLNDNTNGFLDKQLKDYVADEKAANIPLMFFNSVVTRDSRKMIISTQPVRFMMRAPQDTANTPAVDPDAVDFTTFFAKQDPYSIRMLTAMRMNATFPIVLPNVWLPSNPVIDVMDAGLRDNYGQETTLRFLISFQDWIKENTGGVLVIQIRDRSAGGWEAPYLSDDISDHATKPFLLLQHNWFKMMEFFQNDMLNYYVSQSGSPVYKVAFQYAADKEENKAALNFHLTKREEKDIINAVSSVSNQQSFKKLMEIFEKSKTITPTPAGKGGNIFLLR